MKNTFQILAALSLCLALGTMATAAPQSGRMGGPGKMGGGMRGMSRMEQELGLTQAQKAKIMAIQQAQRPQMMALFQNKSLPEAQKRSKMMAMMGATMKKMTAILTPAQRKKLDAMRREQLARRAGHM